MKRSFTPEVAADKKIAIFEGGPLDGRALVLSGDCKRLTTPSQTPGMLQCIYEPTGRTDEDGAEIWA